MRTLMGVTGVTNAIQVIPNVTAVDVEKRLHDALTRQADREAGRIQVTVKDGEVRLSGKVHSWAELNAVQGAAWPAPGVSAVVNNLVID